QKLKAESDDTVDRPLITLWEQLNQHLAAQRGEGFQGDQPQHDKARQETLLAWERKRQAIMQQMAKRMGSLPFQGDKPVPGSDREATRGGSAYLDGLSLRLDGFSFYHPEEGVPALADWLHREGVRKLRYDI